jgi:hypothetical protein
MGKELKKVTSNVVKNFTPAGWVSGGAKALGLTKSNMIDDAANAIFGKGGGAGPRLDQSQFDTQSAVDKQVAASRAAAQGLITDLQAQSRGQAPSLADAQLRAAGNRNLAQQLSAAAAQRGGNPALLQRALVMQQGQQGRDLAEQSAQAKLQERQMAQSQLGSLTLGQQSADLGQVMDPARLKAQGEQARFEADVAKTNAIKAQQTAILGQLINSGASAATAAMSDKTQKKDIKPAKKDVKSFLDALEARSYEYKDPTAPGTEPGKRVGIMAQDLEKSSMGKALVKDTEHGKMVDTVQGFGAVLAAQSELNKRLKALEKKKA